MLTRALAVYMQVIYILPKKSLHAVVSTIRRWSLLNFPQFPLVKDEGREKKFFF